MKRNRKEELKREKTELEASIQLTLAMVYDNRFDTSIALDLCNKEEFKTIVDAYVHNEEFLKNEVFNMMCRIYKINSQLDMLNKTHN